MRTPPIRSIVTRKRPRAARLDVDEFDVHAGQSLFGQCE